MTNENDIERAHKSLSASLEMLGEKASDLARTVAQLREGTDKIFENLNVSNRGTQDPEKQRPIGLEWIDSDYGRVPSQAVPPPVPTYQRSYEREECDVVIGEAYAGSVGRVLTEAYARGNHSAEWPMVVGLTGNIGTVMFACGHNVHSQHNPEVFTTSDGRDAHIVIAALRIGAKISPVVANLHAFGRMGTLRFLGTPDNQPILLGGAKDSFCLRAMNGIGELVLDDFKWEAHPEQTRLGYASEIHVDQWETLILRDRQAADTHMYREHFAYTKSDVFGPDNPKAVDRTERHGTWIVDCNLDGGNRTGIQIRPGKDEHQYNGGRKTYPSGAPVVIANNHSIRFGADHEGASGGGTISVWSAPHAPVFLVNNRVRETRYCPLVITGQGPTRDWLNTAGYPLKEVHMIGNYLTQHVDSKRPGPKISAVQDLYLWSESADSDPLVFDDAWSMEVHGIKNGEIHPPSPEIEE